MNSLDAMIAELAALDDVTELEKATAVRAAKHIEAALRASLTAGTSPEGQAWAPRKEDGGRAYKGAVSALAVKASGSLIRATVTGPEAYGQFGVRGAPKRLMLPEGGAGMPPVVAKALEQASDEMLAEKTK